MRVVQGKDLPIKYTITLTEAEARDLIELGEESRVFALLSEQIEHPELER